MNDQEREDLIRRLNVAAKSLHDYSNREGGETAYHDACLMDDAAAELRHLSAPGDDADEVRDVMNSAGIDTEFTLANVRALIHYYQTEMHKLRVANAAPVEGEAGEVAKELESPINTDAFARAIYAKQCEYVGADHEGKCVEYLREMLESFEALNHRAADLIRRLRTECAVNQKSSEGWHSKTQELEAENERLQRAVDEYDKALAWHKSGGWHQEKHHYLAELQERRREAFRQRQRIAKLAKGE